MGELRARVFLSSGQKEGTDEVGLISGVKQMLEDEFGFKVSVGTGSNVPAGVSDEVARRLRDAEYFILADFARETVAPENLEEHTFRRGSLFSQQELAIAIFRGLRFLVFQEEGIPARDGILKHVPSHPITFKRDRLIDEVRTAVRSEVERGLWDPGWRNELSLSRDGRGPDEAQWIPYGDEGRLHSKYFHVSVTNHHRDQIATGVRAYLEGWSDAGGRGEVNHPPLVELKFAGVRSASVSIPPSNSRQFDAAFVFQEEPGHARIGINTFVRDWLELDRMYHFEGAGRLIDLNLVVYSNEFEPARKRFRLSIGKDGQSTELYEADPSAVPKTTASWVPATSPPYYPAPSGVAVTSIPGGTVTARTIIDPSDRPPDQ